MWRAQKMQYDRRRREVAEIIRWSWRNRKIKHNSKKNKSSKLINKLFNKNVWKKSWTKHEKMLKWEYVSLTKKEQILLRNKNFLNSQNYISSKEKEFKLFYYSKEKINNYRKSKILINKIEKDLFEKFYINFFKLFWINKNIFWHRIYLWNKLLYLVKHK